MHISQLLFKTCDSCVHAFPHIPPTVFILSARNIIIHRENMHNSTAIGIKSKCLIYHRFCMLYVFTQSTHFENWSSFTCM